MTDLQNYVSRFGFGISVRDLADKAYWEMVKLGHDVCLLNDRYLIVDGTTYLFSKSRKQGGWIVKEF